MRFLITKHTQASTSLYQVRAAAATITACFLYPYNAPWTSFPATKTAHLPCRREAEIVHLTLPAYIGSTAVFNFDMSHSTQSLPNLSPKGSECSWNYSTSYLRRYGCGVCAAIPFATCSSLVGRLLRRWKRRYQSGTPTHFWLCSACSMLWVNGRSEQI